MIINPTARLKIVAAIASVKEMPIIAAENTKIASPIPRFPGVIAIKIDRLPIDEMNNALKKLISMPKI